MSATPVASSASPLGLLRMQEPTALAAGAATELAGGRDRQRPQGLGRDLRRAPGHRRAAARPRDHRRPQRCGVDHALARHQGPPDPPAPRPPYGGGHLAGSGPARVPRDQPNQLWMTDITEHPTREGKLYCCVVLDAFSRMVVGWSIDSTQTTALVLDALGMATRGASPSASSSSIPIAACRVDSTGRRNALIKGGLMGRPAGWMQELTGRSAIKSPGRPSLRREVQRAFWREIAKGVRSRRPESGRGVWGGWQPVVQRGWWDAVCRSLPAQRPVPVVYGA